MNDPVGGTARPARIARMAVHRPVFVISAGLILAFVLLGSVFADEAQLLFARAQALIIDDFGWFYIIAVAGFLVFVLFLMISRYGDVKLGPDESEPDYSYMSWLAMLFSAGMGIGLVFFGVAEPIQHYAAPPVGEGRTVEAARQAMALTFLHWGLHAWAIYIVVGLALAYFAFRRGLPLTPRSALFPLIGKRIYGPIGHAIDIFAVIGTMFGVATSLGFGVLQVNAGFAYLFGLPTNTTVQIILIALITGAATFSVAMGLDRGVKRLSELNIAVAALLLVFVLLAGSTVFLLQAYVQNIGTYLSTLVQRTFSMYAYEPNPWIGNWTLFYWGWWMAWSPFVGMFIARISRGRTIREFVTGVLIVPVLFSFLWMTVFGNTAIALDLSGLAPIAETAADNLPVALFVTLEQLPLSAIASALATLLVMTFFITSADSGALVIDIITSGGSESPGASQRVFWAVSAGVVAAVLLVAGGLQGLQTAAIASALPFALVMVFMCYGLLRALQMEGKGPALNLSAPSAVIPDAEAEMSWQQRLAAIIRSYDEKEVLAFLSDTARPALDALAAQMRRGGLEPQLVQSEDRIDLAIAGEGGGSFHYCVRSRAYRSPSFSLGVTGDVAGQSHYRAMASSSEGDQPHDVTGYTGDQLIDDLLQRYARYRQAVRPE